MLAREMMGVHEDWDGLWGGDCQTGSANQAETDRNSKSMLDTCWVLVA